MDDTRDSKPELAKKPTPGGENKRPLERNLSVIRGANTRPPGGGAPPPRRRQTPDFITSLDRVAARMQRAMLRKEDPEEPSRCNAMVLLLRLRAELYSQHRAGEKVAELERELAELRPMVQQVLARTGG